jgi:hypothetical protein
VGGIERVGYLNADFEESVYRERTTGDAILERFSFKQLHHEEKLSFVFRDVVNGADVGVIQGGSGAGFAAEALQSLRILVEFFREEFESDLAAELEIFGGVDDAHSASAEFFKNAIVRDGVAGHEVNGCCAK